MAQQTTIQEWLIRYELVNALRSADVLTTTQRGVTTTTQNATLGSPVTSFTLNQTTAKNVRSLTIDAVTQKYAQDYYLDTGGVLRFTSAKSGALVCQFDYGTTDAIYPDLPQDIITIKKYPRIGLQWLGASTEAGGFGSVDVSDIDISIVVYGLGDDDVGKIIASIRSFFRTNKSTFWTLGSYVQVTDEGPYIIEEFSIGSDKVVHKNIDVRGMYRYEK